MDFVNSLFLLKNRDNYFSSRKMVIPLFLFALRRARRHSSSQAFLIPFPAVETGASYQLSGVRRSAFRAGKTFTRFLDLHDAFIDMFAGAALKFIDGHCNISHVKNNYNFCHSLAEIE
jgi:hypothetical protein